MKPNRLTRSRVLAVLALVLAAGCAADEPATLDPEGRVLLRAGVQALQFHQFTPALALADSIDARTPGAAETGFLRGRIYSEMMRWEEAEAAYRSVARRAPDYPGVWNNLGNIMARQARYRDALALYRKELEYNPAPIPWREIGKSYRELGVVDSARYAYDRAIALDSTYALAYVSVAHLLDDDGEFAEALTYAKKALALDPESVEAQYLVGSLLLKNGDAGGAIRVLQVVALNWPWHSGTHLNLGQALLRAGRQEEGEQVVAKGQHLRELEARISYLEKTVAKLPQDAYAHASLAGALRMASRYNDAMHAYQVALSLDPENLEFHNNVAALHFLRNDTTAAIRTYHYIVEKAPETVDAWLNLGVLYALSGDSASARRAWQAALHQQPDHPDAKRYLARLGD